MNTSLMLVLVFFVYKLFCNKFRIVTNIFLLTISSLITAGHDVLRHSGQGSPSCLPQILSRSHGNLRWWWHQTHFTRSTTILCEVKHKLNNWWIFDWLQLTLSFDHCFLHCFFFFISFRLDESAKNRKLNDLLDALEFNQVVIFVSKVCAESNLFFNVHPPNKVTLLLIVIRSIQRNCMIWWYFTLLYSHLYITYSLKFFLL